MQRNSSNCIRVDIVTHPAFAYVRHSLSRSHKLLLREKVKHGCPASAPVEPLLLMATEEASLT